MFMIQNRFRNKVAGLIEEIGGEIYEKSYLAANNDLATRKLHDRDCLQLARILELCAGELSPKTLWEIELDWKRFAEGWRNYPKREKAQTEINHEPFDDVKMQKIQNLISLVIYG